MAEKTSGRQIYYFWKCQGGDPTFFATCNVLLIGGGSYLGTACNTSLLGKGSHLETTVDGWGFHLGAS